ncbi:MAG: hypothetical protein JJ883_19345 [Thalassospira sp.]|uniref:DISARM system phospholipase D-like protein DrmC n=1 Tax=Thalassospira sp. TaxID=1912094 RepID=UPI001B0DE6C9|nr:DISARM system phospholipase D-like protein DrmC [Thalassospira sp.]MBO6824472.1 hypothetical protein [Pseudomonadales bacterium]MBO6842630.1 hypothetical protein [Thalassospira sp.]
MTRDKSPVGAVRPSQILWTYGPGALIDLPSLSVITMGNDRWEKDRCIPIEEARLLAAVRNVLGPQVEGLRVPPFQQSEEVEAFSAEALIGVPVRPFPRWLRCVKCGLLSEYDLGLFKIKEDRFRPENTRFVHEGCKGSKGNLPAKDADAVPARFLMACRNGHLDDFPWHYFVHSGPSDCKGTLRFFESGASLQTENLWVKCDECGASRSMAHAFGKAGKENLPQCRGRHPHLDRYDDDCGEQARAVLLGATNSWFPITLSALAIPLSRDPISQLVQDGWDYFEDVESEAEVSLVIKTLKKSGALPGIDKHTASAVWNVVATRKTEQALLQVIKTAKKKFFLTSFVAYDVASILTALAEATERGVEISMLLESSDAHGGGVSVDAIGHMKKALPSAKVFYWREKTDAFFGGKVHAKVAVADEVLCFLSSANLTGHAMEKNMEAGVLIRGGDIPRKLHQHLEALITTKILERA